MINKKISKILKVSLKEEIYILERTFYGDSEPVILVKEYIPKSILIDDVTAGSIPQSFFDFADTYCQERIEYSISEIIPKLVTSHISEAMGLPQKAPV